jgi:putative transcriptional regulator
MGVALKEAPWVIRWRLRVLMAEKNISNKELAERSGVHRVSISKLKQSDELKQITGDVLNKLCNGLTAAYRARGEDTIITPGHLIEYAPDELEASL